MTCEQYKMLSRTELEEEVRRRADSTYLGQSDILCRVLGKYKMVVDGLDKGLSPHLIGDGFWEMWITQALSRLIKPGMTVYDIGANLGYYTLLFADLVGADGSVVAFEPAPRTAELLSRNVSLNGFASRTSVVQKAVSDIDGDIVRLFSPSGEPKNATLLSNGRTAPSQAGIIENVAVTTVDAVSSMIKVDLIKIDAEGAEEKIFDGMTRTIERDMPVISLEFNAARYNDPSKFIERIQRYYPNLQEIGFDAEIIPTSPESLLKEYFGEDRILMLRPSE